MQQLSYGKWKRNDNEVMLLTYKVLLAEVFLVPRCKVVLDDNQVERAKETSSYSSSNEMDAYLRHKDSEQKMLKLIIQHEFSGQKLCVALNKIENI